MSYGAPVLPVAGYRVDQQSKGRIETFNGTFDVAYSSSQQRPILQISNCEDGSIYFANRWCDYDTLSGVLIGLFSEQNDEMILQLDIFNWNKIQPYLNYIQQVDVSNNQKKSEQTDIDISIPNPAYGISINKQYYQILVSQQAYNVNHDMVFNQKSGWFVATEEQAAVIRNYILTCVQWKNWHKIKITPDVCDGVYSKIDFPPDTIADLSWKVRPQIEITQSGHYQHDRMVLENKRTNYYRDIGLMALSSILSSNPPTQTRVVKYLRAHYKEK